MKVFLSLLFVSVFSLSAVQAQDEVSDQQLYKFAIVEETKQLFATELSAQITDYVEKQDPAIKNRYNALAGGETPANDSEKQFIEKVQSMESDRKTEFTDAYKTLIKRVLGAKDYSTVKKAIASDARVRSRYSEIVESIRASKSDASASAGE
ncbi:hypothetical protein PZB74_19450 [Porifericola rhodea]|uniref:hypothetical protein n=1 Tax=Porifericola rhodea TaxID=930972 RepID=UPI0026654963|nr:hypothetical protein [Porifericola rhodea]WKN31130.1 hypothetical protein PZB74_19450 [Porifericola rhodea]